MSSYMGAGSSLGYMLAGGDTENTNNINQTLANNAELSKGRGDRYSQISALEQGAGSGLRNDIQGKYWDLFNQAGSDEGGGGVGAYTPTEVRYNEAMQGYRDLARTGGWTPEDIAASQSIASASGEGLYQGLRNQMLRSAAGSGGVPVYASTLARMGRDSAYSANKANMENNANIQADIRNRKQQGLQGVGQYDTEYMSAQEREAARANAHAAAAASYASNRDKARRAEQAGYLNDLMRVQGTYNDIPYANLAEGAYGAEARSTSARPLTPDKTGLQW